VCVCTYMNVYVFMFTYSAHKLSARNNDVDDEHRRGHKQGEGGRSTKKRKNADSVKEQE
jgi:hypothetical protein